MTSILEQLDAQIAELLASWNVWTTLIALTLTAFVAYPLVFWEEPDTHPLLLSRQAAASPVRNRGESAVYRSLETPYGYPLKTGLNVKDASAPRWAAGKNGDVRDVWRQAVRGGSQGEKGRILTAMGNDSAMEHSMEQISKEIKIIGQHLQRSGGTRVAIYAPNSVEYLTTVFACAFYGLSPILIPNDQPPADVIKTLLDTNADCLVAPAGSLPLLDVCETVRSLKEVTWMVERTSRQMDWHGTPEETAGRVSVSVWHELVAEQQAQTTPDLPENSDAVVPGPFVQVWQATHGGPAQIVEFTQKNMVSAIAALLSCLPARQRFSPSDLVLPADSFTNFYVLCQTLAALYSHASLAVNSVAGPGVDLELAARSISPTVIITSAETLFNLHKAQTANISSFLPRLVHSNQGQAMSAGRMPTDTLLFKLLGPRGSASSITPGVLRLLLVAERAGAGTPVLTSAVLSDLRIFTRARICYALTAPQVAGAVTQTNLYDYRTTVNSQFGVPLSSVEVKLVDKDDSKLGGAEPQGEIIATGPAVAGGEAHLGIQGKVNVDCTLSYV